MYYLLNLDIHLKNNNMQTTKYIPSEDCVLNQSINTLT